MGAKWEQTKEHREWTRVDKYCGQTVIYPHQQDTAFYREHIHIIKLGHNMLWYAITATTIERAIKPVHDIGQSGMLAYHGKRGGLTE